ncbi:MAG: hypothetical protein KGM24_04840 [Elusimicrobia bacterium]|nr:hypothetical protein [Elusimicrobiota bacterium]
MSPALVLVLALARPAPALELGGHARPTLLVGASARPPGRETLDEMWRRGILPPDQSRWSPADEALLLKIRAAEPAALALFRRRYGTARPWTVRASAGSLAPDLLTKAGYRKFEFLLAQDAISYFQNKGADAKWVFRLTDWEGKPLFDGSGLLTDEGVSVYRRARRGLRVFWRGPGGRVYGTRRPPAPGSTENP